MVLARHQTYARMTGTSLEKAIPTYPETSHPGQHIAKITPTRPRNGFPKVSRLSNRRPGRTGLITRRPRAGWEERERNPA